ncbi:MAG: hypothetical protein KAY24_10895 [Candidatus Eisenbacteria sp.]|nr:hypothetical protein [Candidatus Eisenbacteria bacterium]
MKKLLVSTACVLLLFLCPTFAHAVHHVVTWTGGGDGISYCDPNNWDLGIVPCNFASVTFDVIIPAGVTVNLDCSCEVTKLTLEDNSRLKTLPANDYIMDVADIYGIIDADNATFFANPFYLLANRARAYAQNGANVAIGSGDPLEDGEYFSTGLWASAYHSHPLLATIQGIGCRYEVGSIVGHEHQRGV